MRKILPVLFLFTFISFVIGQGTVIDDFETDTGNWEDPNYSGSTTGVTSASSFTVSTDYVYNGSSSGKLLLIDDTSVSGGWFVRMTNRDDQIAHDSKIGFWLRAHNQDVELRFVIWDNGTDGDNGYEAGSWFIASAAEDDWEWVELDLANDPVSGWITGNGEINSTDYVTIESIQLQSSADISDTLYIDDITEIPYTPSVSVTFALDMSNETVSDSGVHIAGNMQGWDPATSEMTDLDADSVYEITFTGLATGDTLLYTFINGNTWSGQEDNTGLSDCGVDNGFGAYNRIWVVVDSADTVGPVCFSSCIGCDEVYVTFQVDMENEDISVDGVHVAGSFQGWDPGATALTDDDGDTVYTVKLPLTIGETIYFKYINGDEWGEDESVPSECADGGNRYHTVGNIDETLPEVCFGSCDPCEGLNYQEANVTFQADMTNMNAQGFDPNIHTLEVRGGFNGWAGGDVMVQVFGDPNTYVFDTTLTVNVGDQIEWKFKTNPDSVWNNGGWETGDNHSFEWTGDDIILDPIQPAILPMGEDLLNDVTISFEVEWIDGTLNVNTGEPFPVKPDTIVFNGSYLNGWYTWGDCMGPGCQTPASPDMPRLTDDDGDDFFTGTLDLPAGHTNLFMGKFGAFYPGIDSLAAVSPNGAIDNEAGFGADYVIVIPVDATTYTYAGRFGENNPDNPWVGIDDESGLSVVFTLRQNYPNPFNPVTAIKFDLAVESDVNLVIYDLLGHEIATLVNDRLNAGYHNVEWNGTDRYGKPVSTGIYIYRVTAGDLTSSKKMLLLK